MEKCFALKPILHYFLTSLGMQEKWLKSQFRVTLAAEPLGVTLAAEPLGMTLAAVPWGVTLAEEPWGKTMAEKPSF